MRNVNAVTVLYRVEAGKNRAVLVERNVGDMVNCASFEIRGSATVALVLSQLV